MAATGIDWDDVTREATDLLCRYIAIDTSNPPGNERAAAEFLAAVLRQEGIESEIFPFAEGRASMSARLTGDGRRRPLVLLNHMDVVPADRALWEVDPFAGVVRNGAVWGRGALDMKSMGVVELMTVLLLRRQGIRLGRDVLFVAAADEETGGGSGIEWLDANHPELFDAEYVINEGGYGSTEMFGVRRPIFSCSVGEKGPLWLRLTARGTPGHSSVPHADNSLERLVRALYRIQAWKRPITLLPVVRTMFERLHAAGVLAQPAEEAPLGRLAEDNPLVNALLTDTVAATTFNAGMKTNVMPPVAEANLDCRLLPGHDPNGFARQVRSVIDDPRVEVEMMMESHTPVSTADSELYRVIEAVTQEEVPGSVTIPTIATGFTDSRAYRRRGIVAYGFVPCLLEPAEVATVHGNNEHI
ncbi:MAG: M20/M25/M40 family metallo-hydrolase, partial [Dehalococcoidia bacterium]